MTHPPTPLPNRAQLVIAFCRLWDLNETRMKINSAAAECAYRAGVMIFNLFADLTPDERQKPDIDDYEFVNKLITHLVLNHGFSVE